MRWLILVSSSYVVKSVIGGANTTLYNSNVLTFGGQEEPSYPMNKEVLRRGAGGHVEIYSLGSLGSSRW